MDLKAYYRKVRKIEEQIQEPDVVVVSCETPDGGKAGVVSEVSRRLAAKLVVEGRARVASEEAAAAYRAEMKAAYQRAQEKEAASQVRIAVISEAEMKASRGKPRAQAPDRS